MSSHSPPWYVDQPISDTPAEHVSTRCLACDGTGQVVVWRLNWKRQRSDEVTEKYSISVESEEAGYERMQELTDEDVDAQVISGVRSCNCKTSPNQSLASPAAAAPGSPVRGKHPYTSTACGHGLHDRCRLSCKFCASPCMCQCHRTAKPATERTLRLEPSPAACIQTQGEVEPDWKTRASGRDE